MKRILLSILIVVLSITIFGAFSVGLNGLGVFVTYDVSPSRGIIIVPDLSNLLTILGSLDLRASFGLFHAGLAVPFIQYAINLETSERSISPVPFAMIYLYGGLHLGNSIYALADVGMTVTGPFAGIPLLRIGGGINLGKHWFFEAGFMKWLAPVDMSYKNFDLEFGYEF
ncbi:hypothetical protein AT15_09000 [Kosmotoga arenicorallina S304]|uniref:Uncharacterized protein n=1 Tax=Kosmotoga arenicorallina S304 TaxID=1453497 RepID=A0A176K257_9BACT|nr:hypothetical protein [Kosmotoga arenicorallina]OAA31103.1 hypothetical protein AT15_09000 [Kosmotoga arenicorallina S304]